MLGLLLGLRMDYTGWQEEDHEVPGSQHLPVVPQGAESLQGVLRVIFQDNLLSVWCLERENNPARSEDLFEVVISIDFISHRLVLVEIPSRRELASRSRTQARAACAEKVEGKVHQVEASMHWQSEGDYLCLINTKLSKTKKKGATNLEILRIREKNIPVDIVEALFFF